MYLILDGEPTKAGTVRACPFLYFYPQDLVLYLTEDTFKEYLHRNE